MISMIFHIWLTVMVNVGKYTMRWSYRNLKKTVDPSKFIHVPLLYPQMFFFLQLFCVLITWWICLFFCITQNKKIGSFYYRNHCDFTQHLTTTSVCHLTTGFRRFFDPVDQRFPTQTFDTTRFNSELEGWPERPERPNQSWRTCGSSTMPKKKGGDVFLHSSQQKFRKNKKNAWNLDLAKLNLGGKDVNVVNQHIQFHLFEWYSWTVLLGIPKFAWLDEH